MKELITKICKWVLGLSKCEFVELGAKTHRLSAPAWFYIGLPPTVNESAHHEPQIKINTCMVLKQVSLYREYIVFEVKTNECKDAEQKMNGRTVYYKKDLFDKLGKEEIT